MLDVNHLPAGDLHTISSIIIHGSEKLSSAAVVIGAFCVSLWSKGHYYSLMKILFSFMNIFKCCINKMIISPSFCLSFVQW